MKKFFKGKDLNLIDTEYLLNNSWDVVELNVNTDINGVTNYIADLEKNLKHLYFDFSMKDYLRPEIYKQFKEKHRVSNYVGNIGGWSISWPAERDIPTPGKSQGNKIMYPELEGITEEEFYFNSKPMSHYKFGYMNVLLEQLTEKALRQMVMSRHHPGLYVLPHTDSDKIKLHIPFETNSKACFFFGENKERKYYMEIGKMYLINPSTVHGTENNGTTNRTHLLSRVDNDFISALLKMDGTLK